MNPSLGIKLSKTAFWFVVIFLIFFSTGCPWKTPIHKPSTTVNPGDLAFTPEQLNLLIQSGITAAGWQVISNRPGEILAGFTAKGNRVVVAIGHNDKQYEITHRDSSPGLKYNNHSQVIHKNYNKWVDELDHVIQTEITRYFVGKMDKLTSSSPKEPPPEPPLTEQPDAGPVSDDQSTPPGEEPTEANSTESAPANPPAPPVENQ